MERIRTRLMQTIHEKYSAQKCDNSTEEEDPRKQKKKGLLHFILSVERKHMNLHLRQINPIK
jgi:hypothetical protein